MVSIQHYFIYLISKILFAFSINFKVIALRTRVQHIIPLEKNNNNNTFFHALLHAGICMV